MFDLEIFYFTKTIYHCNSLDGKRAKSLESTAAKIYLEDLAIQGVTDHFWGQKGFSIIVRKESEIQSFKVISVTYQQKFVLDTLYQHSASNSNQVLQFYAKCTFQPIHLSRVQFQ